MMNKRAVSAVVATVLIILITVAAVTIIWTGVKLLVENKVEDATACAEANAELSVVLTQGYTCLDTTAGDATVQIRRGPKTDNLIDIAIMVSDGGDTVSNQRIVDDLSDTIPEVNSERTYAMNGVGATADTVRIAAVIQSGNLETTCDASATFPLNPCT
jgi:hypothetical protein